MRLVFRILCAASIVFTVLSQNWLATVWVVVALVQHERAEMIHRWNRE